MSVQTNFLDSSLRHIAIFLIDPNSDFDKLVSVIMSLKSQDCIVGFDRSLWAKFTSGCVPPQLYDMDSGISELSLFIMGNDLEDNIKSLEHFSYSYKSILLAGASVKGELIPTSFVEDDFVDGRYLAVVFPVKENLSELKGARMIICNDTLVQLYLTEEIYELENLLIEQRSAVNEGQYYYIPSIEKLSELPELLNDVERVHLAQNITGIRC